MTYVCYWQRLVNWHEEQRFYIDGDLTICILVIIIIVIFITIIITKIW